MWHYGIQLPKTLDNAEAQLGGKFIGINADVTRLSDLETVFKETSERFGKIDVIVANAGGAVTGAAFDSAADTIEADYDLTMDLNLKSVYFTVNKALPYMNDGGSVILIGSNAAHRAHASFSVYGASKAAVIHFAKGFSNDLLHRRIRVNVISPGTTDTPVFDRFVPVDQLVAVKKYWGDVMQIGRIGQPSEIGKWRFFWLLMILLLYLVLTSL